MDRELIQVDFKKRQVISRVVTESIESIRIEAEEIEERIVDCKQELHTLDINLDECLSEDELEEMRELYSEYCYKVSEDDLISVLEKHPDHEDYEDFWVYWIQARVIFEELEELEERLEEVA